MQKFPFNLDENWIYFDFLKLIEILKCLFNMKNELIKSDGIFVNNGPRDQNAAHDLMQWRVLIRLNQR